MARGTRGLVVLLLVAAVGLQACGSGLQTVAPLERAAVAEPTTTTLPPTTLPPTTEPPTTAAPAPPPPTTAKPRPRPAVTAAPRRAPARPTPPPAVGGVAAYAGLGAWVDVFDWSSQFSKGNPTVGPAQVDRMASLGVQTLYIQAARWDSASGDVVEPERLRPIIQRAHAKGIRVVVWYLPTFVDVNADLRRLLAIAGLGVEGLAVDIESREVQDPGERSRRLVELSDRLRAALPGRTLGAIVFPPTGMEVINPSYWPGFPWAGIAHDYDVWLPMAYWSGRTPESGWKDGYRYTADNVRRVRNNIKNQAAPVHPVGGVADKVSTAEVQGMVRAVVETASIGGSLYDYNTTAADAWPVLHALRR